MTTIKTYQAQLPLRNYRIVKPVPLPRPALPPGVEDMPAVTERVREKIASQLAELLTKGYWYCPDCHSSCERIEDDHGQPAHCGHCGGIRIYFVQPIQTQEMPKL